MAFEIIRSEKIYQGRVFSVRCDQVSLPNGKSVELDIVEHTGAVTLVPVDDQGNLWFVRQYRHAAGVNLLELPAGSLEPGELPEACALREVREEIGMAASHIEKIGEFFMAPGYSTEFVHIYLVSGLHPAPLPADEDEFLNVETIPIKQVFAMVAASQIHDCKTLASLYLAQPFLVQMAG
jgi:ADP-ribose pyrophosphatase